MTYLCFLMRGVCCEAVMNCEAEQGKCGGTSVAFAAGV